MNDELVNKLLQDPISGGKLIARRLWYNEREMEDLLGIFKRHPKLFSPKLELPWRARFLGVAKYGLPESIISHKYPICMGDIVLNWPEIHESHPLIAETLKLPDATSAEEWPDFIRRVRTIPGLGHPTIEAIVNDDTDALKISFRKPLFDINAKIDGYTLLQHAICWNSIKCFYFLLLNQIDTENAMVAAVAAGRTEMIEVLEQHGVTFADCASTAAIHWQNEILEWLVNTDRDRNQYAMTAAISSSNSDAVKFLLANGFEPSLSDVNWTSPIMAEIAEQWIDMGYYCNPYHVFVSGPESLCRKVCSFSPDDSLRGALHRVPFVESLCKLAIDTGSYPLMIGNAYDICNSLEAYMYITARGAYNGATRMFSLKACLVPVLTRWFDLNGIYINNNPIWWKSCSKIKHLEQLQSLGVNVAQRTVNGGTFLHYLLTFKYQRIELIDYIIKKKLIDIKLTDKNHMTVMELARKKRLPVVVRLLILSRVSD